MKKHYTKILLAVFMACMFMTFCLFSVSAANKDTQQRNNLAYIEIQLDDSYSGRQFEVKTNGQTNTAVVTVQSGGVLMLEVSGDNKYILTDKSSVPEKETATIITDSSTSVADEVSEEIAFLTTEPSAYPVNNAEGTLVFGYIPLKNIVVFAAGTVIIGAFLIVSSKGKKDGKKKAGDSTDYIEKI